MARNACKASFLHFDAIVKTSSNHHVPDPMGVSQFTASTCSWHIKEMIYKQNYACKRKSNFCWFAAHMKTYESSHVSDTHNRLGRWKTQHAACGHHTRHHTPWQSKLLTCRKSRNKTVFSAECLNEIQYISLASASTASSKFNVGTSSPCAQHKRQRKRCPDTALPFAATVKSHLKRG